MTVRIHILAFSESAPATVLDDLGSKFRDVGVRSVKYDVDKVDVEQLPQVIDTCIADDEQQAQAGEDATP